MQWAGILGGLLGGLALAWAAFVRWRRARDSAAAEAAARAAFEAGTAKAERAAAAAAVEQGAAPTAQAAAVAGTPGSGGVADAAVALDGDLDSQAAIVAGMIGAPRPPTEKQ